ncbi:DUF6263 family protein [Pedobacter sp. GR22-6]|uniref:DUF6263 family protein n=1 Tax=Pedobacter sp. GR22-6 TaxID=3127957 RepID=UPI00307CE9EA
MKNTLSILFALLLCTALNAQTYKMSLNLIKGKAYYQTMTSSIMIKQAVAGKDMNINMEMVGGIKQTVTAVENDVYSIDVTYQSIAMKVNSITGAIELNSEKKGALDSTMTAMFDKMKNKSFQITMDKQGKVLDIKNLESLFSGMFDGLKMPEDKKEQIKTQLMQAYGDKGFRERMQAMSGFFPGKAVAKGDTWTAEGKLEGTVSLDMKTVYKLEEVTPTTYVISSTASLGTGKDKSVSTPTGIPMSFDMTGTYISKFTLDRKSCWMLEGNINQEMKGAIKMEKSEQMPEGMSIPMEVKVDMTIKGS